jgi:putative PIN family toxin of toxin-antitoxin system
MLITTPTRLVLDTNVCLDLFVFRDTRWRCLYDAMVNGTVEAITRHDCRAEWLAVLDYARFNLTVEEKTRCIQEFDDLIKISTAPSTLLLPTTTRQCRLPRCTDRDDQKFLELALDATARFLVTKDKALLKLNGKCRRAGLFEIVKPEYWIAAFAN